MYSTAFTSPVLELLAAKPGERIIDFGCGSGEVTLQIEKIVAQQSGGIVSAVDLSRSMVRNFVAILSILIVAELFFAGSRQIENAKRQGLPNAFVVDVQDFAFPSTDVYQGHREESAVFTNAPLHWCKGDPRGVIRSAKAILKDGRFVGEIGGFLNCIGKLSVFWGLGDCVDLNPGICGALKDVLKSKGYDPIVRNRWFFPSVDEYIKVHSGAFLPRNCRFISM